MKATKYLLPFLVLLVACDPSSHRDEPTADKMMTEYDSVYTIVDVQWHKQYFPLLERQVFSLDLLSEGLVFDSTNLIVGTGCNLCISDIFLPITDTRLQAGTYFMDTTAADYTFLPYMYFEGPTSGCYLLDIKDSQLQRIIGFTAGEMRLEYIDDENIRIDFLLYTADSTRYHAIYEGPVIYE